MKRNPTLSVRKGEGISYVRAQRSNEKISIRSFFHAFSTSDSQRLTKLIRRHLSSKDIRVIKSTERDDAATLTASFNAEGSYLPPYCTFKGVNKEHNQGREDATRGCSRNEKRVFIH